MLAPLVHEACCKPNNRPQKCSGENTNTTESLGRKKRNEWNETNLSIIHSSRISKAAQTPQNRDENAARMAAGALPFIA